MSDDNWDADDFDVDKGFKAGGDKWEGEDEEEDVKDNWEDSDEEEEKKPETDDKPKPKKKSLAERIKEKEEKKKAAREEQKRQEEEARRKMTPEELLAEKLRAQKLQEESDLDIAMSTFGVTNDQLKGQTGLEAVTISSPEDFTDFGTRLAATITKHSGAAGYTTFLTSLFREIGVSLTEPDDVRQLASCLSAVANEKVKEKKGKSKKKKAKAAATDDTYEDFVTGEYAEFEDFM